MAVAVGVCDTVVLASDVAISKTRHRGWLLATAALACWAASPAWAESLRIRSFQREGARANLVADFDVAVAPDRVFDVLIDDGHFDQFMPYVTRSEVQERMADGALVKMHVRRLAIFDFTVIYDRRYRPDRRQVTWRETTGFFKHNDGSWTLAPKGTGTRVTYQISLEPGFPVPDFILKWAMRQGLPEIADAVRKRSETWAGPERTRLPTVPPAHHAPTRRPETSPR